MAFARLVAGDTWTEPRHGCLKTHSNATVIFPEYPFLLSPFMGVAGLFVTDTLSGLSQFF